MTNGDGSPVCRTPPVEGVAWYGRPLVVLGDDQPGAAPVGPAQVGEGLVLLRAGTDQSQDPSGRLARPDQPHRRHRAVVVDEAPEFDGAGLDRPAQPGAGPPHARMPGPRRRGVLEVVVEIYAATRCKRIPKASTTSSATGTVCPAKSATVHATRRTPFS